MKKCLYFLVGLLLLASCSHPINIVKFQPINSTINEGDQTYLEWEVQNADRIVIKQNDLINNIKESTNLIDSLEVSPTQYTVYTLIAYKGDADSSKSLDITVQKKAVVEDPSGSNIVQPNVESQRSYVLSPTIIGRMPISSATANTNLIYEIVYINQSDYPDEVMLYVTVKDQYGNFITNLAPPYGTKETAYKYFLKIVEEVGGRKYPIGSFEVEEKHDERAQNYNFSLVLDHSGSMFGNIDALHNSVIEFVNAMADDDKSAIIKFDSRIERTVPLTSDKNLLWNPRIYNGLYGFDGSTSLIAAGDEGINSLAYSDGTSKIEILFTDGLENSSFATSLASNKSLAFSPSQLINNARNAKVRIFTIGFGNADANMLERISKYTDGKSFYANNNDEINKIFNELPRVFHNYYLIRYWPIEQDGMHDVTLTCSNTNGKSVNVCGSYYVGTVPLDPNEPTMPKQLIANFVFSKDTVRVRDLPGIIRLANFLTMNPNATIILFGHTDLVGEQVGNMDLGERRAKNVKQKLIMLGIETDRIMIVTNGMNTPIYNPEMDEYQANENRRVEYIIRF